MWTSIAERFTHVIDVLPKRVVLIQSVFCHGTDLATQISGFNFVIYFPHRIGPNADFDGGGRSIIF
jgi:hypothetical protein